MNTPFLHSYFLNNNYKQDINTKNPLGTKGRLAEEFAVLLKEMWTTKSNYVSPIRLKSQLASFAR